MWSLVRDGKDQPERYFSIGGMIWQPIGGALAFTACPEKTKCRLYVNNQPSGPEDQAVYSPKYSKDGMHLAYMGRRDRAFHPVLDGKKPARPWTCSRLLGIQFGRPFLCSRVPRPRYGSRAPQE